MLGIQKLNGEYEILLLPHSLNYSERFVRITDLQKHKIAQTYIFRIVKVNAIAIHLKMYQLIDLKFQCQETFQRSAASFGKIWGNRNSTGVYEEVGAGVATSTCHKMQLGLLRI